MTAARAERRRAQREVKRSSNNEPQRGGVFGRLNDGRVWTVRFQTSEQAERFLQVLGPPPATEDRLRKALKEIAGFHSLAVH